MNANGQKLSEELPERRSSGWIRAKQAVVTNNVTRGVRTLRDMNDVLIDMKNLTKVGTLGGAHLVALCVRKLQASAKDSPHPSAALRASCVQGL